MILRYSDDRIIQTKSGVNYSIKQILYLMKSISRR